MTICRLDISYNNHKTATNIEILDAKNSAQSIGNNSDNSKLILFTLSKNDLIYSIPENLMKRNSSIGKKAIINNANTLTPIAIFCPSIVSFLNIQTTDNGRHTTTEATAKLPHKTR